MRSPVTPVGISFGGSTKPLPVFTKEEIIREALYEYCAQRTNFESLQDGRQDRVFAGVRAYIRKTAPLLPISEALDRATETIARVNVAYAVMLTLRTEDVRDLF